MRAPKIILLLLVVAFAAIVYAEGEQNDGTQWSPVVYPEQRLPVIFSHAKHLAKGATCATCHPAATTSRSAVDNLIPTEAECRGCHPIDRAQPDKVVEGAPTAKCVSCHPGWTPSSVVQRVYLTPTPLKFDHAAHIKTACTTCHGDMTKVELATTKQLPTMSSCLTCHKNGGEERACADCHLTKVTGLVETEFPQGSLMPKNTGMGDGHRLGFAKDHTQEARQVGATCNACHDQSECIACHQGVVKPADFHPGDYVNTHAIDARRGTPDCSACHRAQSFCVGCHERTGVAQRLSIGFSAADGKPFHPSHWASNTSSGSADNRHAAEARRNLTSCTSCHREEDCLTCHSAQMGSLRASPHPPGWRGSSRCKALDRGNRRMCLRCHVAAEELGCDWKAQ
ncbi:MAG TPA: cytochrome c3 family protein [Kofleriaceae bacterium]|jgi:hypothetical protein